MATIKEMLGQEKYDELCNYIKEHYAEYFEKKKLTELTEQLSTKYGIGKTSISTQIIKPLKEQFNLRRPPKEKIKSAVPRKTIDKDDCERLKNFYLERGWGPRKLFKEKVLGDKTPSVSSISNYLREVCAEYRQASQGKKSEKDLEIQKIILEKWADKQAIKDIVSHLESTGNKKSRKYVEVVLRENGIDISQGKSEAEEEIIYNTYLDYGTEKAVTILAELGIKTSATSIRRLIKEKGLSQRDNVESYRKYKLENEDLFAVPSADARYFLGLMLADGWVRDEPTPLFSLELASVDEELLVFAQRLLGTDKPIENTVHYDKRSEKYTFGKRLTIFSKRLVSDLKKFGITAKKSLTANPNLTKFSLEDQVDFWRGCVDGDGSLFFNGRYPGFELCGSKQTVEQFIVFLNAKLGITGQLISQKNIYRTRFQDIDSCLKIVNMLYPTKVAIISLSRKTKIAELWKNIYADGKWVGTGENTM